MKSYRICFVKGALVGKEFSIGGMPKLVGRSSACDIRIPDKPEFGSVSREHVMLYNAGDALFAVNRSKHKTLFNGQPLPHMHKTQLLPGMVVSMGDCTEFRVNEASEVDFDLESDDANDTQGRVPSGKTQATVFGDASEMEASATSAPNVTVTSVSPGGGLTGELTAPMTGELQEEGKECEDAQSEGESSAPKTREIEVGDVNFEEPHEAPDVPVETGQNPQRTMHVKTVVVSQEELAVLLAKHQIVKRIRTYKRVAIFVGSFLLLAIAYFCMRPHPETRLTWPRNSNGKYDDRQIVFKCPLGENAVGALCPQDSRIRVRETDNGVTIVDTYIGKDRDVPLRLKFVCEKSPANLRKSRNQLFDEKRRELEELGGWNFLALSPLAFIGPRNGIPYRGAQYLRSEKNSSETQQWFGCLVFVAHGDCALTFTREIPAIEQWRGGNFLVRETMLQFGEQIINGHWEGRPDFRDDPVETMLAEADGLLSRRSPLLWKDAEFLLQSVMIKSGGVGKSYDEAMKRLVKLRGDQQAEFNRLMAMDNRDTPFKKSVKEESPALEEALRVFSSPDDRRNALLKKGKWK